MNSRFRDDPHKKGRIHNGPEKQRMERCEYIKGSKGGSCQRSDKSKKSLDLTLQKLILVLKRTDSMETMCRRMKERVGSM